MDSYIVISSDCHAGLPQDDIAAILGENAIRFYGFDRAALAPVAERIGPRRADFAA